MLEECIWKLYGFETRCKGRKIMDIGERPPVEGVEDETIAGQAKVAKASGNSWSPNEEFIKALVEMGVSRNAAEKV